MATITPPERDDPPRATPGRLVALVVTGLVVVSLVGGWAFVLFVYDPDLLIDELEDRTFPVAAEQVCAAARTRLADLPPANQARSAADRSEAVARSNVILTEMIDELEPLVPPGRVQVTDGIQEWLDDWRVYISNREDYVEALGVDEDARFLESAKGAPTKGITRAIDGFAEVNRMESCTTPGDVS